MENSQVLLFFIVKKILRSYTTLCSHIYFLWCYLPKNNMLFFLYATALKTLSTSKEIMWWTFQKRIKLIGWEEQMHKRRYIFSVQYLPTQKRTSLYEPNHLSVYCLWLSLRLMHIIHPFCTQFLLFLTLFK